MYRILTLVGLFAAGSVFVLADPAGGERGGDHGERSERLDHLDHRDDFRMNSVGGGDFRDYVSDNVHEDDLWAHSMRTFGTFHNHMHELMTLLAHYDAEELGGEAQVPSFHQRISGGQWSRYRQNLEAEPHEHRSWQEFVQIMEVMHDRVHHAMYNAMVYDNASRERDVDLLRYADEDRAPYASAEMMERIIPGQDEINVDTICRDTIRSFVWNYEFEGDRMHAAAQSLIVFDVMLHDLLHQWAEYGATMDDAECRPPQIGVRMSREEWQAYADQMEACGEKPWRDFVRVAAVMNDRISHMMFMLVQHDAAVNDRSDVMLRATCACPTMAVEAATR